MPVKLTLKKLKPISTTTRAAILVICVIFIVTFIFRRQDRIQQLKYERAIHILIDRAPGGLVAGQPLDIMGRRFLPLQDDYQFEPQSRPDHFEFVPKNPQSGHPRLDFQIIRDETTRALKFLRGEADVLYDTLAISKTEWLKKQTEPTFRIYSHSGLNLSFVGFSLTHPILKNRSVRLAIAKALPVADWAKYKLQNWVDLSTEFVQVPFDPEQSKKDLDHAGYPAGPDGVRFTLKYYTTGVREGGETALLAQEALKKVGIEIEVITLDTLLYFQKMKKGDADLFSTRWFRFSEQEPIIDYLSTGGTRNYFGYSNPKLDQRLKKNPVLTQTELAKIIETDFPFFPLYTWKHGLILGPRLELENETRLVSSMDESFRFLLLLGLK